LSHSTMSGRKTPNPTDRYVGARVRMRRLMLGMSQTALGNSLGVTFQQVQKYEKGTNRIGASRLQQISGSLQVPVAFFFEELPIPAKAQASAQAGAHASAHANPGLSPNQISAVLATSDGLALVEGFARIKSPKLRRRLVDLVERLGDS
jgi:transcriptional regulator with XRE-family HTH domain